MLLVFFETLRKIGHKVEISIRSESACFKSCQTTISIECIKLNEMEDIRLSTVERGLGAMSLHFTSSSSQTITIAHDSANAHGEKQYFFLPPRFFFLFF